MVLIIDLANDRLSFGVSDGKRHEWRSFSPGRGAQPALAKALRAFGLDRRTPDGVALVERGRGSPERVSWSLVRAGVALANTLAFAWDVPVAAVTAGIDQDEAALAAAAWKACRKASRGSWVSAVYSGEPNITRSKKLL